MNTNRLQSIGMTLGLAFFTAAGLTLFTAAEKATTPPPSASTTLPPLPASSLQTARALNDAFVAVADRVRPAVVSVYSDKVIKTSRPDFSSPFGEDFFRFFGGGNEEQQSPRRRSQPKQPSQKEYKFHQGGMGSGILIDKVGHILTNNHVVQDVDEIKVTLADKRVFEAEIIGTDPKTDLAVIKIKGKIPANLPVAEFGDSDEARIGEMVLAIGAPFGYAQTVTHGILSAKSRSMTGSDNYEDFLQTDAAINPGNSGGPLVNLDGKVIGINTAIATRVGQSGGVGFAIPSNMVKSIWPTLAKGGKVTRGLLGVIIQNVDSDLKDQFKLTTTKGAVVSQVNKDSAAEKAGVKVGDVIIRYNGKEAEDVRGLRNMIAATAPGTKNELTVIRNGKEKTITVQLTELKIDEDTGTPETGDTGTTDLGLKVEPLTPDIAKQLSLDKEDQGVVIREVEEESPAGTAGLRPGDLITEVNREKVMSVKEFTAALKKADPKASLLILVKSKEGSRFAILKPKAAKD